jgi:gluconokinase
MNIILMGITGSGKTAVGSLLARKLNWEFFDADDFHPKSNREKLPKGILLTDEDRAGWLLSIRNLLEENDRFGKSILTACSVLMES